MPPRAGRAGRGRSSRSGGDASARLPTSARTRKAGTGRGRRRIDQGCANEAASYYAGPRLVRRRWVMARRRQGGDMPRWRMLGLLALIPLGISAGFGLYLLSLAGELPGQVAPTPISAGVTPFAVATAAPQLSAASPAVDATSARSAGGSATPVASPGPGGAAYAIVGAQSQVRYVVQEKLAGVPVDSNAVGSTRAIDGQIVLDAS